MDLLIGIVGMVALAGLYVALGLADRGGTGCEGCRLQEDLEGACRACPDDRRERAAPPPGGAGRRAAREPRTVTRTGGPVPASPSRDGRPTAAGREP